MSAGLQPRAGVQNANALPAAHIAAPTHATARMNQEAEGVNQPVGDGRIVHQVLESHGRAVRPCVASGSICATRKSQDDLPTAKAARLGRYGDGMPTI